MQSEYILGGIDAYGNNIPVLPFRVNDSVWKLTDGSNCCHRLPPLIRDGKTPFHSLENVMHYLLLIGAVLWFSFLVPLKVMLATVVSLVLITSVIRYVAHTLSGVAISFGDAVKAIGNSFIFLVVAVFTLLSLSKGTGITHISGLPGIAVFGAFLVAYILGFQISLRLSFGTSSVIALVSTLASTGAFLLARSLL